MPNLTNRIAIITGASGNLGQAAATVFERAAARLALFDRSAQDIRAAFPDLADPDAHLLVSGVDMTQAASVNEAVARVVEHFGRVDVLVHTVGGFRAGARLHETPTDTLDFMLNLNARTYWLAAQAVLPHMLAGGWGRIVGVAARPGLQGRENMSAYSVSKAAVIRLTESMAAEYREAGITANCVIPGTLDTPQNRAATPDADFSKLVQPESLANVMLFLASEEAADVSGAVVPVYGRT
jgi:NAD(P)-dependent dehydrogenase (short-subunit alcohol dehydrogenase family)